MSQTEKKPIFRKIAPAIWTESGDPSVYGFVDLDVTALKDKDYILPYFVKALNELMLKYPVLNTYVRWRRITSHPQKMISVMVNIPTKSKDLSALHIVVHKDVTAMDIKKQIDSKAEKIRSYKDPYLGFMLKIIDWLPNMLVKLFISVYEILIYDFKTNLNIKKIPKQPFGSIIVSNVGSLGLKNALLPLVPLARASVMISIGKKTQEVKVIEGQMAIRDIVCIGVTFDHRLFDGAHAAQMLAEFEKIFAELIQ